MNTLTVGDKAPLFILKDENEYKGNAKFYKGLMMYFYAMPFIVGDDGGKISLKWFRYRKPWLQKRFPVGQRAIFIGEIKRFAAIREIHHPESELINLDQDLDNLLQISDKNEILYDGWGTEFIEPNH